jgi:hypothetical protein
MNVDGYSSPLPATYHRPLPTWPFQLLQSQLGFSSTIFLSENRSSANLEVKLIPKASRREIETQNILVSRQVRIIQSLRFVSILLICYFSGGDI